MKLAIIEDRIGRLDKFAEFNVKENQFVEVITGNDFDNLISSLSLKETSIFDKYHCVAVHRSAITNELRDIIKDYCKAKHKALVFFSGGITSSVYKQNEFPFLHINSKDFYSLNLQLFLKDLEKTDVPNLLILQFGEKWKLSLLLSLRNKISVSLNKMKLRSENYLVSEEELIKRLRDLDINSLIKEDLLNSQTEEIFQKGEYSAITTEEIHTILTQLNNLIFELS